jgi:membrane protease YdiL (CAAX protease family)
MVLYRWVIALSACVGILAVAAGSAPVVYLLIAACDKFFSVDWLRYLTNKPLECCVDRLRIIIGCIVVLVAVRRFPKKYHWNLRRGFWSYAKTFLFGIFVWMTLFFVIKSFVSDIEIKAMPNAGILSQAFIVGLLLATAEEVIFRGFLWDFVRNGRQTFEGIFPLALVFALLHFSRCDAGSDASLFIQSFQCARHSITDIPQHFVLEFFLCVFLLSLLLCGFRMQTQTLWGSVGFHQGLVTTLFVLRKCVRYPEIPTSHFWGTGRLTDSRFVVIALCCLCVWMFWRTKKQALMSPKTK